MLKKVVIFDFDGTMSARDANLEFGKYCFRHSIRPWLFIPVIIFGGLLSLFDFKTTKMRPIKKIWREVMRSFVSENLVKKLAPEFIKQHKKLRWNWVNSAVAKELNNKDVKVILISAGPDFLVPYLVNDLKFDAVLTSDMQKHKPWKFNSFSWGDNKVVALEKWAKKNKIQPIVLRSYGDSYGDTALMALAQEAIWIDSKTGNRKI